MINVNKGKSHGILSACKPLAEYAWIVDAIREGEKALKGMIGEDKLLETAIDRAIDALPEDFITKPYLEAHRAEVKGMLLTEYNEAKAMELFKEEGREEGRIEGRLEGRVEGFELFALLVKRLLELGRSEDVARISVDPAYRDKLIAEFQLV